MDTLKMFGAAILIIGFIYFLLIRAFKTNNYIRKSFFLFISGLVITSFFIGGIIYDISKGTFDIYKTQIEYFSFLLVSIFLMIVVPLFYFFKGFKRKQRFKNNFKTTKVVPTIKDKTEFVYIIFRYNDSFFLEKTNIKDEIYYKTICLKFSHNDFFHDEIIKNYIIKNNLNITSYKYIGKAIKKLKKDNIFYCYRVVLNELPQNFNNYETIDSYKLLSIKLNDDDKKIIFTSVVNEDFNILL